MRKELKRKKIVYCFIFPNGKKYVGKTQINLESRLRTHKSASKKLGGHLYNAIRKYGWENITVEILEECETIDILNETEVKYIKELNCLDPDFGYNLRSGGQGGTASEETKKKISEKNSGCNNGMFGKVSGNFGKKSSEETKQKLSESHLGQTPWNKGLKMGKRGPQPDEVKEKISKANSGEGNGKAKLNSKIVNQIREEYDRGGVTYKDLSKKYCVSQATITNIINFIFWRNI